MSYDEFGLVNDTLNEYNGLKESLKHFNNK